MLAGDEEREWARLVRKTRLRWTRHALLTARVEIVETSDQISIRNRRRCHRLAAAAFTAMAVGALWWCVALARDGRTEEAGLLGVIAVVTAAIAALSILSRAGISWHPRGKTLTFWSGIWPFVWRAELPKREIGAQLSAERQLFQPSEERSGFVVLSLRHERWPGLIRLACRQEADELRQALDKLNTFLDSAVEDELLHTMKSPDGREIAVDTAALRRYNDSYGGRLELPADDLAIYRCSGNQVTISNTIPFLLSAVPFAIALGVAFYTGPGRIELWVALPVLGIGALFIAAFIAAQFSWSAVEFDLDEGVVSFRGRFPEPESGIDISDIAAVQVCCWYRRAGERSGVFYEVNLVLWDPPGHRVNLLTTPADRSQVQEARRLANHIRVPFFDHTR